MSSVLIYEQQRSSLCCLTVFVVVFPFLTLPRPPAGRQRLLYQLAGVVPSPLLLELLSCPLCARSLETLELELGEPEGGRGEADGLHDFHQVGNGAAGNVPEATNYHTFSCNWNLTPPTLAYAQVGDLRGGRGRSRRRGAAEYRYGVVRAFVGFREKLKRIVESKYFNRGIMIAILVNTLSMGIEYHQQVSGSH